MAITSTHRIFYLTIFIWHSFIILQCSGYNDKCTFVTQKETFVISGENNLGIMSYNEVHIRHNLKGSIQIKDSPLHLDQDHVTIQVEKQGENNNILDSILVKQYRFDDDGGISHYIIQLEYEEQVTSIFMVVGGTLGTVILLTVIVVVVYIYHKKHKDQTPRIVHETSFQNKQNTDNESTGFSGASAHADSPGTSVRQHPIVPHSQINTPAPPPPISQPHLPYDRYTNRTSTPSQQPDRYSQTSSSDLPPPPPPMQYDLDYAGGQYTLPKTSYRCESNTLPKHGDYTLPRGQRPRDTDSRNREQVPDSSDSSFNSPQSNKRGAGTPKGLHRSTLLSVTIFATLTCMVYASCIKEPRVNLVLFVPATLHLGAVKIFSNTEYFITVEYDEWIYRNNTRLKIYDVKDASDLKDKTCPIDLMCQQRATCEPNSQQCVCERGYQTRDDQQGCEDVDECKARHGVCPVDSGCQNTQGSYICHCGINYYHQHGKCKVCSHGCPEGEFEMIPCTYEADRICSDAAHPVLISENDTRAGYLEGLKASSSENVFMENLHNTKQLETGSYITENKQESDFLWFRDSGIRINIGIRDVMVIPEFTDVTYKSDNNFVLDNPSMSQEKSYFNNITKHFCRHPIPESYLLTLEVYKDRTTAATEVVCGKNDVSCPEGYHYADIYINRTLDEPCEELGTYPDKLKPNLNSIVCTEATDLLKVIFNQTAKPVRPISFQSKPCKQANVKCTQCIAKDNCNMLVGMKQKCCETDCYTQKYCTQASSPKCKNISVKCAMGDSYRYTIQPVFGGIRKEFTCHLKLKKPKIFYKLWFYVSVIGTKFETPKIYTEVTTDEIGNTSKGSFKKDFFTIEHNTGIKLNEDMILHGKQSHSVWNYKVYNKKKPDEYERKKINLVNIPPSTLVAPVQFNEPFAYSSTTWVNGNNCNKNTSYFRSEQPHYYEESGQVVTTDIHMPKNKLAEEPYRYVLRSTTSAPYMKFIIPSNVSVLDWWFREQDIKLHIDDTLKALLTLTSDGRIWNINITGNMTACPGYLNIIINDRLEFEELFRYDLLISCPTTFSLNFKVPNRGQKRDKTFDIILNDTHQEHTLFLTYLGPVEKTFWFNDENIEEESVLLQRRANWSPFIVVVICLLIFSLTLFVVHIYLQCSKINVAVKKNPFVTVDCNTVKSTNIGQEEKTCTAPNQMTCLQFTYLSVFLAFKIVYSFCFTFTIFYTVVLIVCKADLYKIRDLGSISMKVNNQSIDISSKIEKFNSHELIRQMVLFEHTLTACDLHTEQTIAAIVSQMKNITVDSNMQMKHGRNHSIGYHLVHRHEQLLNKYGDQIKKFEDKNIGGYYDSQILPVVYLYDKFLKDAYKNNWLMYVSSLYNESKKLHMLKEKDFHTPLDGEPLELMKYMDIENAQNAELLLLNFWERYSLDLPELPKLNLPTVDLSICDLQKDRSHMNRYLNNLLNITVNFTKYELMNTTRHSEHIYGDHLPPYYNRRLHLRRHEFISYINHSEEELYSQLHGNTDWDDINDFRDILDDFDFSIFKLIFLFLDILLILYRFSHMYIDARHLCHGFEENVLIKDVQSCMFVSELEKPYEVQLASCSDRTLQRTENEYSSTHISLHEKQKDKKLRQPKQPNGNILRQSGTISCPGQGEYLLHKNTQIKLKSHQTCSLRMVDTCEYYTKKFIQTSLVTKCVFVSVMLFTMFVMLICVNELSSEFVLMTLGAIFPVFSKLSFQARFTNWYLDLQASHASQSLKLFYSKLSYPVLEELQGLVHYFNNEQNRLAENYADEICAINTSYLESNHSSCTTSLPVTIDTHILHCDAVPLQPLHFQYEGNHLEKEFTSIMLPYMVAASDIITSVIYVILILGTIMVIIHTAGCLLFHYFKTRRIFPVHVIYILPSFKKYIQSLDNVSDPGLHDTADIVEPHHLLDPSATLTSLASSTSTLGSKLKQVKFSPIRSTVTVPRTDTMTSDLGYSETKV